MTIVLLTLVYAVLQPIRCYKNLAREDTTVLSQSSTYRYNNATLANDGNLWTTEQYCAHTAPGHIIAWFQVDLGRRYNVHSVKIYFRREVYWPPFRLRHFYLDVSNSSAYVNSTTQRTRCYTDNTTAPNLPPNIINIPCKCTTRYVIVETTYDAPEDKEVGAILEICEIEVNGCDTIHYEDNCSIVCSVNCIQQTCNNITGSCTLGCIRGFYGDFCNYTCSGCVEGCHRDTGECKGACPVGTYGLRCEMKCSLDCESGCDKITGFCSLCVDGMFGESCNQTCSTGCVSGCDRQSGKCVCKPAQQLSDPTTNYQPYFYGVVVVMCTSFVLNIFSFTWMVRQRICQKQNGDQSTIEVNSPPPVIYDAVEDNTGYQELGQLSPASHYSQLQKS